MNKKEISELRRRFKPEKANIGKIYGCYVNGSSKEIMTSAIMTVPIWTKVSLYNFTIFIHNEVKQSMRTISRTVHE